MARGKKSKCLVTDCKNEVYLNDLCQVHHTYYNFDRIYVDQKELRYLSLDISKKSTGFAYFKNKKLISFGAYKAHIQDQTIFLREFETWITGILKMYKPHVIVVEALNVGGTFGNVKTSTILAEIHSVVKIAVHKYNATYVEYMQLSTWRSKFGVKSKKKEFAKPECIKLVNDQYKTTFGENEDDIAEAIGIGNAWYGSRK